MGDESAKKMANSSATPSTVRERLAAEAAATPRLTPRPPPPPPWFTAVAAAVPAVPIAFFLPLSTLACWLPVWVAVFYGSSTVLRPILTLLGCFVVTYRGLVDEGWTGWSLYLLTLPIGFLMNLVEGALWDTLEPFLIGQEGFGQGTEKVVQRSTGTKPSGSAAEEGPRVTAASAVHSGDPTKAVAASAFTQAELDVLASNGVMPWDPQARAALEKLGY